MAPVAVHRVVRELAALPRQPGRRSTTAPPTATGPTRSSRPTGRPASSSGTRDAWAARVRGDRARATSCSSPSTTTATACGRPTSRTRTGRAGTAARRRRRAGRGGPRRGPALRPLLLGRARLDVRRPADRLDRRRARAPIPRGDYPAYAEAQVRELIARYRPSVLWNDIAWPAEGKHLVAAVRPTTTRRCPTASSTTAGCRGSPAARAVRSTCSRRAAARRGAAAKAPAAGAGSIPPEPPALRRAHARVRVVRRRSSASRGSACGAWTTASATTRSSRPEHFLAARRAALDRSPTSSPRAATCSSTSGPRGEDAQIPDEQLQRLDVAGGVDRRPRATRSTRPGRGSGRRPPRVEGPRACASPPATRTSSCTCWPTGSHRHRARRRVRPDQRGRPGAAAGWTADGEGGRRRLRLSRSTVPVITLTRVDRRRSISPGTWGLPGQVPCPGDGTEHDAGLGLGVEERGLGGHALAGGGVGPDLGHGGRPDEHAGLRLARRRPPSPRGRRRAGR